MSNKICRNCKYFCKLNIDKTKFSLNRYFENDQYKDLTFGSCDKIFNSSYKEKKEDIICLEENSGAGDYSIYYFIDTFGCNRYEVKE